MHNILHIHGFNSSPLSTKAIEVKDYFAENFPNVNYHCPQLAVTPKEAINQLEKIISEHKDEKWYLIGSSLGGFFSTYLSEKYQLPAVLINPAVKPFELLIDYIGEHINPYTNEVYQVEKSYIDDLLDLNKHTLIKKNYLVMVQTGDEVLDYQQAVEKYQNSKIIVQVGGDHSFVNFADMLPEIANFFHIC